MENLQELKFAVTQYLGTKPRLSGGERGKRLLLMLEMLGTSKIDLESVYLQMLFIISVSDSNVLTGSLVKLLTPNNNNKEAAIKYLKQMIQELIRDSILYVNIVASDKPKLKIHQQRYSVPMLPRIHDELLLKLQKQVIELMPDEKKDIAREKTIGPIYSLEKFFEKIHNLQLPEAALNLVRRYEKSIINGEENFSPDEMLCAILETGGSIEEVRKTLEAGADSTLISPYRQKCRQNSAAKLAARLAVEKEEPDYINVLSGYASKNPVKHKEFKLQVFSELVCTNNSDYINKVFKKIKNEFFKDLSARALEEKNEKLAQYLCNNDPNFKANEEMWADFFEKFNKTEPTISNTNTNSNFHQTSNKENLYNPGLFSDFYSTQQLPEPPPSYDDHIFNSLILSVSAPPRPLYPTIPIAPTYNLSPPIYYQPPPTPPQTITSPEEELNKKFWILGENVDNLIKLAKKLTVDPTLQNDISQLKSMVTALSDWENTFSVEEAEKTHNILIGLYDEYSNKCEAYRDKNSRATQNIVSTSQIGIQPVSEPPMGNLINLDNLITFQK